MTVAKSTEQLSLADEHKSVARQESERERALDCRAEVR
jgi:hypothetical protein